MNSIATIEDLLEAAAGMSQHPKIQLDKEDITIMHSIARQVFKGTALTDRQFALMQEKLSKYKDQFINSECDFDYAVEQLRQPLREIDRSKYIKICKDNDEIPLKGIDDQLQWIKIRFPFKKSIIIDIQSLSNKCEHYHHSKGSHEHFFSLTDLNIKKILDIFLDKEFKIDKELILRYNAIQEIVNNKLSYIPYFDGDNLVNCHKDIHDNLIKEINEISSENFLQVADRQLRHGYFVECPTPTTLAEKIAFRKEQIFHSNPNDNDLKFILSEIYNLDRFPLLVLLEEHKADTQLHSIQTFFRDLIPSEVQSVLFRQSGSTDFNDYVKERNLNNWVDNNTKIVYINTKKIPKILLNDDWKPITTFSFTSTVSKEINAFINFYTDLQIFHETDISPFRRYSRLYG